MYSPKISEELVPQLYRLAKAWKVPMTALVNELLEKALAEVKQEPGEEETKLAALKEGGTP